ncbi:MAG: ribosome assembly factor SBDS [Candidatus Micrarchaeota archaeon]|nr:ribosome assembly factor SBDS [Candidatus Micrarchaeota archaeon]
MSKTVIAKYIIAGESFEIFVDSDKAYAYITGKLQDPLSVLEVEDVFKDANKGDRQSQDKLKKAFNTEDLGKIAGIILKNGNVPLTTEQRNKLLDEKRRQIVNIIATNAIDPRTNAPHTPQRIENAMQETKITIDAFKSANEQVDEIVKKLSMKLPLKFSTVRMEVTISPQYTNRSYSVLKQYGLKSERWLNDGSLFATLEFPAGLQSEFFDKLNNATKGSAVTKIVSV